MADEKTTYYPAVDSNPDFPAIEKKVLSFWEKEQVFAASVSKRPAQIGGKNNEYIFYDGPPFANGLPHYGHLLTSYVKDIVARYRTMKGERVERRFGWDCHGLPAEMESEKELNISGRIAIEEFGIGKFNDHCRESVMKYTDIWQEYVNRAARWVDFENDYKTMDTSYMESVIWAFKELYDKGLVYESHRVMPYSWAAETPLSNFETRMDNAYRNREDKAVTVAFKLKEKPKGAPEGCNNYYLLAWTTTPWTLPSNLALAVHPDINYACIAVNQTCYLIATSSLNSYAKEFGVQSIDYIDGDDLPGIGRTDSQEANSLSIAKNWHTLKGAGLVGLEYEPLFPYFKGQPNAFRVLAGDFIEEGSGTGIVHMAPGFGEDDQKVCEEAGIALVCPVDSAGKYTDAIFDLDDLKLKGLNVIAATDKAADEPYTDSQLEKYGLANLRIITWLKAKGTLVKQEDYTHSYPHCWRTDTPLIYRALPSWYVEVTKFKDRMVELNQNIHWIPEHIKDGQFGKWLENARDWSISRNRFWGCPIPVWRNEKGDVKVFGSIKELEDFFLPAMNEEQKTALVNAGSLERVHSTSSSAEASAPEQGHSYKITDLHRPFIDTLTKTDEHGTWTRVSDVFDCWFESGSMPFAQVHYPFENKEWFDTHFPADFIVEYVGQTRGWFYTLMVLGTALFDSHPFKNCICHGIILDAEGKKLSKRLRNYPDPNEMFNTYGADAVRWRMVKEPILHGGNLLISKDGSDIRDVLRLSVRPIWNAYNFFTLYANSDGIQATFSTESANLMDRYILAKCKMACQQIEQSMDAYLIPEACKAVDDFFEVLNNWYIRRNRDRFWKSEKDADKQTAYNTLYSVLHMMCRAAAPLLPLITEEIFAGLTAQQESVHLQHFPDTAAIQDETALVADMDRVRDVCNAGLSVRNTENIRTRQPLQSLTVYGQGVSALSQYGELIKDELNVKEMHFSEELKAIADFRLNIYFPVAGKRLGGKMKDVAAAAKQGNWEDLKNGTVRAGEEILHEGEFSILLQAKDANGTQALSSNDALVKLDLTITEPLRDEGIARDLVRLIQQTRKEAELNVSDRIALVVKAGKTTTKAIKTNQAYIEEQTLSELSFGEAEKQKHTSSETLEGETVTIGFSKKASAAA